MTDPAFEEYAALFLPNWDPTEVMGLNANGREFVPEIEYPEYRHYQSPNFKDTNVPPPPKSESPIAIRTLQPTSSPTESPTAFPTEHPTESPTESPTASPTASPTEYPTASPTEAPTSSPTSKPTVSLLSLCKPNDDGSYGTIDGNDITEHSINYKYRMVALNVVDVSKDILPDLENKLLNALLEDLFPSQCSDRRLLLDQQSALRQNRQLSIVGASSSPIDLVSSTESCTTEIDNAKCFVIDGKMKVFADSNWDDDSIADETCKILNDSNSLKPRHIALESLECVSDNLDLIGSNEPDASEGQSDTEFQPVSNSINSVVTVMTSFAAIMVVFGVVFYRRRHRKETTTNTRTSRNNVDHLDDSDINASTSISFEEAIAPGPPAMNFTSILHESVKNSANGIGTLARNSYFPETIHESSEEDTSQENESLEEVSLDGLNRTYLDDSILS